MGKKVETINHKESQRVNIPTAEYQSMLSDNITEVVKQEIKLRNHDLDPQLVWRGKKLNDDLEVFAPPIFIQEKVHPKHLIDDLIKHNPDNEDEEDQLDLFSDFNGFKTEDAKTEFYQHDSNWTNRMILGDSLQIMASLSEREGLRGKVQCIYFDPPYGIKFNSNFQWSTTTRDVKDGKPEHITREPEQVKAFRDTWKDGIHSYLTYLKDRIVASRELLSESGSMFVQIGDENRHRVRCILDEVFGPDNFVASIEFTKSSAGLQSAGRVALITDTLLWYAKDQKSVKYRKLMEPKGNGFDPQYKTILQDDGTTRNLSKEEIEKFPADIDLERLIQADNLTKPGPGSKYEVEYRGKKFTSGRRWWGTPEDRMGRLLAAGRVVISGSSLRYARKYTESRYAPLSNIWTGFLGQTNPVYVVQTNTDIVQRCILMTTDPGDLVLDPTCGSGTTAYVCEKWARRWITLDTSRVALALARSRLMGAKFPYYLLTDSKDGQKKISELNNTEYIQKETFSRITPGFVYKRVPKISPSVISNNAEIDSIIEKYEVEKVELLKKLNSTGKTKYKEWEIPSLAECPNNKLKPLYEKWWDLQSKIRNEIDASIDSKAERDYLFDQPYEDGSKIRVSGPFSMESLSPHRLLTVNENDDVELPSENSSDISSFNEMVLENLKTSGVQQINKGDRLKFKSVEGWPGDLVCGVGNYEEDGGEKRAGIFIGPEFGTVARPDLVSAAREAADAGFDILVACAFNFDAHASEFSKLASLPILRARMNADLHMAEDLKNTGKGNLFVVFGEPDIEISKTENQKYMVKIHGVDVFDPTTGEVRSDDTGGIACWFLDTDYNEESFFVRHAYFLGANDPYKSLKNTLKAEIDEDNWEKLHSDESRPFCKPKSGRIAVKVINHLGDEVMKVFKVD